MDTLNPYLAPIIEEISLFFNTHPISNEHQIIKHLQEKKVAPFESFSLANTKDLFDAHFLCMHALYQLKNTYLQQHQYKLLIQSVHIERVELTGCLSVNNDYSTTIETIDPLESYYLNPAHFFDTQESEVNDLLSTFWEKYLAQDNKQQALTTLGLPPSANAKMVKTRYRLLAQQHHPDKGGCAKMFNKIYQAKQTLDKVL